VALETDADAVFWSRRYEPAAATRDVQIEQSLKAVGLVVQTFSGALLFEPGEVRTGNGQPYQVFTPFWRACVARPEPPRPLPVPSRIVPPFKTPASLPLMGLELEPKIDWAAGIRATWQPGLEGARAQLRRFLAEGLAGYSTGRDSPDRVLTSRLSPHLHFGEVSPRTVWHAVKDVVASHPQRALRHQVGTYLRQLGWREFAHHLLAHLPQSTHQPLRSRFARFPWRKDTAALKAWQKGQTGHPLVDAGMRELWTTGWMHNRVRMVTASFLVKDLLLPWQAGAQWFWDTLVDADLANNTLGWQWTAGCGADAAPYFRIFNPVGQGKKFDPLGTYVRRWVPELAKLPDRWIHQPWEASPQTLREAGVRLGDTYPRPIVDHAEARLRALSALASLKP
jgi:deoxyribodipyrimidine photo-lyase